MEGDFFFLLKHISSPFLFFYQIGNHIAPAIRGWGKNFKFYLRTVFVIAKENQTYQ